MIHWNRALEEVVDEQDRKVKSTAEAYSPEQIICLWARIQRLSDQATGIFPVHGPITRVRKELEKIERQLLDFESQVEDASSCMLYPYAACVLPQY